MENYIKNYDNYSQQIIYDFRVGDGGIGDCIKFFMFILQKCINNNTKLYYLVNNIPLEKYLKLKYKKMYIHINNITGNYNIVKPQNYYNYTFSEIFDTLLIPFEEVFEFSQEILINSSRFFSNNNFSYISIHLRLGDMYLETDKHFLQSDNDIRVFNEEKIYDFIEKNNDKNILFFCDNNNYKLKIKDKYNFIIITDFKIGHTSLINTTDEQTLDSISEFYIMTNSEKIIAASQSGFSVTASKFKNIPLINI